MLLGVIFSDCELFSNLEMTQRTYQILLGDGSEVDFPLTQTVVEKAVRQAADGLLERVMGQVAVVSAENLATLQQELINLYSDDDAISAALRETAAIYPNGVVAS